MRHPAAARLRRAAASAALLTLVVAGGAAADARRDPRPLRLIALDATVVAHATALRTESRDDDKLRVYRLRVERVLRGRLDAPEAAVVEIRGATTAPPLVPDGAGVVVLLAPAPGFSYLREQLPEGTYFTVAGGRDGVLLVASDADVETVESVLAEGAAALDGPEAATLRRALAFRELATLNTRLVHDGVRELERLGSLAPLTDEEVAVVGRVLRAPAVEAAARVALLDLVAARELRGALGAVIAAATDTPAVLRAVLAARARLGAPATRDEIAHLLENDDAAVRAAVVAALATMADPEALRDIGTRATTDADPAVRAAAVDALGATKAPEALPYLRDTFDGADRDLQQRSARAVVEIGGPAADDALIDWAQGASSMDARRYAALVLLVTRGRDSEAIARLLAANPPPEVQAVIEHGLEFRHSHHGDDAH